MAEKPKTELSKSLSKHASYRENVCFTKKYTLTGQVWIWMLVHAVPLIFISWPTIQ